MTKPAADYPTIVQKKEAVSNRKKMARTLQEARDKVSEHQSSSKYDHDLLQMFVQNEFKIFIPALCLIFTTIGICTIWVPLSQLLIWGAALLSTKAVTLFLCYKYNNMESDKANPATWITRLATVEFIYGCLWAYTLFLSIDPSGPFAKFFIACVALTSISIRMIASASVRIIAYSGTIPLTIGFIITSISFSDTAALTPLSLAMIIFVIAIYLIFIVVAENLRSHIRTAIEYRSQKDYLIAEIEEAKAFSDEARKQAEEANIAKSRFLATMSHELRTPLNAILGFSEVMKDELFGKHENPAYKEYANDIHNSGRHLLNLINEVLDLSRIEAGRYELHEESFRLSDLSLDCCKLLRIKADKKNVQIIENYNDQNTKIWADQRAIRQIILNLLSNAVKFTPSGGTITLNLGMAENGGLRLSVTDTGPGIPEDEIPTILTNFGQGSLAHETAEGGSGLGLPIVRALVDMHEGSFNLTSELRKGTEVSFTLPSNRISQILPQLPVNIQNMPEEVAKLLQVTSNMEFPVKEEKQDILTIKQKITPVKTA